MSAYSGNVTKPKVLQVYKFQRDFILKILLLKTNVEMSVSLKICCPDGGKINKDSQLCFDYFTVSDVEIVIYFYSNYEMYILL